MNLLTDHYQYENLYKSITFVSLLLWRMQECFIPMPSWKYISKDIREAIIAVHQSGKGYKVISKLSEPHHSTETFPRGKQFTQFPIFPGVDVPRSECEAQRNYERPPELHLRLYRPQLAE
ncbi:hypothetical protein CHARACLAT_030627 [Characodon lateralis]|uniref:Uncharacterized protein n=1 Tax=Characodon lateralis TaxID=208331 RepID=A0ABU7EEH0_9TELE|nr:hypothetical protein [Characodon lateralis]